MDRNIIFWILVFSVPLAGIIFGTMSQIFRYRAMERMAERGQAIPPEMYDHREYRHYYRYYRRGGVARGIYLICLGIAIAIFFWFLVGSPPLNEMFDGHAHWLPALGIFPVMSGLAILLSAPFERRPPDEH